MSAKRKPAEADYTVIDVMDRVAGFEGPSWHVWRAILKGAYAIPMDAAELALFRSVTGDRDPPRKRVRELWVVGGRRGGKDSIVSLMATAAAGLFEGAGKLRAGERALIQCLAVDREQARTIFNYTKSLFDASPPLRALVQRQTRDTIELSNAVDIQIVTNDFRRVRGRSVLLAVMDEIAFWADERSSRPDTETYSAILPSLATIPGAMMVAISTPHIKSGLLFEKFSKHFGASSDDVLVVWASSLTLNPTLDEAFIASAYELDPEKASAEFDVQWRTDIAAFIDREIVERAVAVGVREIAPMQGHRYFAFVDPSGGTNDSMTLAISHREGEKVVVDLVHEWRARFNPNDATAEACAILKLYGIGTVQGDNYGGEWPKERFAAHGARYEVCPQHKSDLYLGLLHALNSARVVIPEHKRTVEQTCALERSTQRGGKDRIDHPKYQHDDCANALAGTVAMALANLGPHVTSEMVSRVLALPKRRHYGRRHFDLRAFAQMTIPKASQGYPSSFLPPERQWLKAEPDTHGSRENDDRPLTGRIDQSCAAGNAPKQGWGEPPNKREGDLR
jgi:hypothetical protein